MELRKSGFRRATAYILIAMLSLLSWANEVAGVVIYDADFDGEPVGPLLTQSNADPLPLNLPTNIIRDAGCHVDVVASAGNLSNKPVLLDSVPGGLSSAAFRNPSELISGKWQISWDSLVLETPTDVRQKQGNMHIGAEEWQGNLISAWGLKYNPDGHFLIKDANGYHSTGSFSVRTSDHFDLHLDLDKKTYILAINGSRILSGQLPEVREYQHVNFRSNGRYISEDCAPFAFDNLHIIFEPSMFSDFKYSGGTGEPNDPYQIATAEDLMILGEIPHDYDKHFILTADIDLDPSLPGRKIFDKAVIAPDTSLGNFGFQGNPFTGVFDGNGHTITHLTISGESYQGLFGKLASGAEVKDLSVVNVNITGSSNFIGGLVGDNRGTVTRCYTSGTIFGTYGAGGLVGYNWASVTDCYSTCAVSGDNNVGGLVGRTSGGNVAYCYSAGAVSGSEMAVGGLVGSNSGGRVTHCYSTSMVNGDEYVGGLVGYNSSTVTHSYSTGSVVGTSSVGGLVGSGDPGLVKNSFWDVETSGLTFGAGAAGLTTAEMMDPEILGLQGLGGDPNWILDSGRDYPRLVWEGTPGQIIPEPVIDWLAGNGTEEDPFQIENADQLLLLCKYSLFWDKDFVLCADIDMNPNLPGRSIFRRAVIPAFEGSFVGNGHVILNLQIEGGDYLGFFGKLTKGSVVRDLGLVNVSVHGSGSDIGGLVGYNHESNVLNCYSTGEVSGFKRVGGLAGYNDRGDVTYCYSTDVVSGQESVGGLVGYNRGDVTYCYSTGAVSGNEYIGGLVGDNQRGNVIRCYSSSMVSGYECIGGLVGYNYIAQLTHCYSSGVVNSSGRATGGLVGSNYKSDLNHCYSTGVVSGSEDVGGLVGGSNGSIIYCYSTGEINGDRNVGGLIGGNYGEVTNSYSSVEVSGGQVVGGLVGYNGASVTECYSIGAVKGTEIVNGLVGSNDGDVTYCFWDTYTSGRATSDGGLGRNTAQMQRAKTFIDAGWDFIDETDNGTEDIWWILDGQDYPRFVKKFSAFSPHPEDGAVDVQPPVTVHWSFGESAVKHNIYFGEDEEAVNNANETSPEYKGRIDLGSESYTPESLALGITYYWRVDEVNEADPNSPWKGNVWSFTTADFIVLDDFESYGEISTGLFEIPRIYQVWLDGFDNPSINGSIVGHLDPPFCEQTIVHSGRQSMPLYYNNSGPANYSEATMTLTSLRDWSAESVVVLSLWFHGDPNNSPEPMYVALNGSAVTYYENQNALLIEDWMEWTIDIKEFADQGVDLTKINTITIGFGDKNNPQPGGSGVMYFDDIRLYRR